MGRIRLKSCLFSLWLEDRTFASPEIKKAMSKLSPNDFRHLHFVRYTASSSDIKSMYDSVMSCVQLALLLLDASVNR